MDDFSRTYEYEDEESKVSGLLLLFFAMLLVCETLLGLIVFSQLYSAVKGISGLSFVVVGFAAIYMAFVLFICFALHKLRRIVLKTVKAFLIIRVVILTLSSAAIMVHELNQKKFIGGSLFAYSSAQDAVYRVFIIPTVYFLIFSIAWYLYFLKSKKVKTLYSKQQSA